MVEKETGRRNLQVHVTDNLMADLGQVAKEEGTSVSNIVRFGIQLFLAYRQYLREGKEVFWIDKKTGEKGQLLIPGMLVPNISSYLETQPQETDKES